MVTNNAANNATAATGTVLQGAGVGTASTYSTATYPSTTTVSQILYSSATNTVTGLATANNSALVTNGTGVPSLATSLTNDFTYTSSTAGATRVLTVTNTDNANTASSAQSNISVGGASAGDPWTQYTIGTARSWSIGSDNSDSDTLKFTTDSDGTVDPSSGTFIGAMTTAGGFEFGANASGTSSSTDFISFRKDQNADSNIAILNNTAGTGAYGSISVASNSATVGLQTFSSSYTVDTNIADYAVLHAFNTAAGLDLQAESGSIRVYGTSSTNRFATCASGIWNYPLQPAFLAYNSSSDSGQAKGGFVTVDFDTEVFDQGGNFAADTFTAPVTGRYQLNTALDISGINTATRFEGYIVTSNRTFVCFRINPTAAIPTGSVAICFSGAVLADMDAADTAICQIVVDGGTSTYTIDGGSSPVPTYFSGKLSC